MDDKKEKELTLVESLALLEIKRELLGITAMNTFAGNNSASRLEMLSRQITKSLTLNNGEVRMIISGTDVEYGKTVHDVRLDNECEVYTIIPKYYTDNIHEVLIIYRDTVTGLFDFRTVTRFMKFQPKFGFRMKWAEGLLDLAPGDILPAGTVLATTVGLSEDGYMKTGVHVNVGLTSHVELAEDAFIISEATRDKFAFTMETTYQISPKKGYIGINKYGTKDNPQVIPRVGDRLPDDGYVYVSRKFSPEKILTGFTKSALMKFDPMFDDCVASKAIDGVVTDVTVKFNKQGYSKPVMPEMEEQLFRYAAMQSKYENDFIQTGLDIEKEYGYNVKFDNEYHMESVRLRMMNHPNIRPIKKKAGIVPFTITIKAEHVVRPTKSYKLSSYQGDKGIISGIKKEEEMPVDMDGNRVDVLIYYGSTIGRMNPGRIYEQYIHGCIVKTHKTIATNFKLWGLDKTFDYLLGFLEIIGGEQYKLFKTFDKPTQNELIGEIISGGLHVYMPVDHPKRWFDVTVELGNRKEYRPVKGPVRFQNEGREVITKDSILVAPMYLALLNKIGDTWLSVASPKLNHYGIPTAPTSSKTNGLTWSPNPVRFGNTEFRLYAAYAPPELLVMIKERANSIKVASLVYRNILKSKDPMNIEDVAPRSEQEYGTDVIVNLINNVNSTFGVAMAYCDEH